MVQGSPNGIEELLAHVLALAIPHDGVLGADEILEVPPGRAGEVVVHLDLLARFHLHLRQHVLEGGAGQDLADGERQLDHIPVDDELEGPLLPAGGPDCDESLHREAAVLDGNPLVFRALFCDEALAASFLALTSTLPVGHHESLWTTTFL